MAVIAGLLLVLVPTLFSLFPEWAEWASVFRVFVLLLWLGAAVIVVTATARQGEHVERLVGEPLRQREELRGPVGSRLIQSVLTPGANGFPDHYEFRVFLPTADGSRLRPSFEPGGPDESEGWDIGCGATGVAWARNTYVHLTGTKVSDGTFGLTPEQQERYRGLQVVAAAPVLNARGRPIAVLSVSSVNDDGLMATPRGRENHLTLAAVVARVLIDVLGIDRD